MEFEASEGDARTDGIHDDEASEAFRRWLEGLDDPSWREEPEPR